MKDLLSKEDPPEATLRRPFQCGQTTLKPSHFQNTVKHFHPPAPLRNKSNPCKKQCPLPVHSKAKRPLQTPNPQNHQLPAGRRISTRLEATPFKTYSVDAQRMQSALKQDLDSAEPQINAYIRVKPHRKPCRNNNTIMRDSHTLFRQIFKGGPQYKRLPIVHVTLARS